MSFKLETSDQPLTVEAYHNKRQKLSHDVAPSLGSLTDEIVIMILDFMYDLDFGDNQRIFADTSTIFLDDLKNREKENDHLNTVKKLEPLRLVNLAWRDIIKVRYQYVPWELSLLPSNSGILPLIFANSPIIKALRMKPLTPMDMHLYLFFLHVYDLRFMKSLLIDLPRPHERWECLSQEEQNAAEKIDVDTKERVLKSSYGLSLQDFSNSWSVLGPSSLKYSDFLKAAFRVLSFKAVSLSNMHLDVSRFDGSKVFKLKSWNHLKRQITHLSLANSMKCCSNHKAKVKSFEKVIENMPHLETLTIECISRKFHFTSSSVKNLRVRMYHSFDNHDEDYHRLTDDPDAPYLYMDFRANCKNLESLHAFIMMENVSNRELCFKITCQTNIAQLSFLNIFKKSLKCSWRILERSEI